MKKTRSHASWNRLTPKQRETLDRWLFEENLSYEAVLPKAESELGYKGSESSLRRYYERRRQERLLTDLKEVAQDMTEVQGMDADADVSRRASMHVLGAYLFRVLRAAPEKVKEWAPVANLIVQNDHNEAWRSIKGEEQKIRREAMEFTKEKFQFDMVEKAVKALPQIKELAEARKDPQMKDFEESALMNRIRREVFGNMWEVEPESPEEAAKMVAAKRKREARKKAEEAAAAKHKRITEELGGAQPPLPGTRYYQEYVEWKAKQDAQKLENRKACEALRAQEAKAAEAERKKLPESQEADDAKPKQQPGQCGVETQERFEELREMCGWQEVPRLPGVEGLNDQ